MEEVVTLKNAVVLHEPMVLLRNERLDDNCRNICMIVRAQRIADVVQQSAGHILFVTAGLIRASRGLQAMFEAIDWEPAIIAFQ
jgi:hypothetical protein